MSFLFKGVIIGRRDFISILLLPSFVVAQSVVLRSTAMFPFFETYEIPISIIQTYNISSLVTGLAIGFLLDRVRRRKPFFLLFFLWSVVSFLPLIFRTAIIVPIYLIFNGILYGIAFPVVFSFFADVTKIHERGRIAGIVYSIFGFLSAFLVIIVTISTDFWFIVVGIFLFIIGIVELVFAKEKVYLNDWRRISSRNLFLKKNFILYWSIVIATAFFWGSNAYLVGNYAREIIPTVSFNFLMLLFIGISAFFVGILSDLYGRRPMIVVGAIIFASSFMIFVVIRTTLMLMLTAVASGIGYAFWYVPILYVIFGDLVQKEARGRAYGMVFTTMIIGITFGTAIGQILIDASEAIVMTFNVFAAFLVILPTMIASETLPAKKKIEDMIDYIKEIDNDSNKIKNETID